MPIDPNIPLSAGNFNPPTPQTMMSMAAMGQQYQQQQKAVQANNLLTQLYQQSDSLDDQGNLTTNALKQVMRVDPQIGMKIQENQLRVRQQKLHVDMLTSKRFQDQIEFARDVKTRAYLAYEETLPKFGQEQAIQAGQKVLTEGIGQMQGSGLFDKPWMDKVNPKFDPSDKPRDDALYMKIQHTKQQAQQWKEEQDVRVQNAITGGKREQLAEREFDAKLAGLTGGSPAERDAQAIAKQKIADKEKELGHPLNDAEKASIRQQARIDPKILEAKEKGQANVITDDAANLIVDRILTGDSRATINLGRGQANMTKIENVLAAKAKERKISAGQLMAMMATVRADSTSLSNLTKMTDSAVSFENTANKNFELALKLAPKAIPTNWGPWVNKWVEKGEAGIGGTDVPPYVTALMTAANEYAKIMSGSTGAQGSTVDSRKEAADLFSPYLSKGQIKPVVEVAQKDMTNRKASLNDQLSTIKYRIAHESPSDSDRSSEENPKEEPAKESQVSAPTKDEKGVYHITSQEDFNALPKGAFFVGPDGKRRGPKP